MRRKTSFQLVGRTDVDIPAAQLKEIDVPHGGPSLPALLRSFGRSPYAHSIMWLATRSPGGRRVAYHIAAPVSLRCFAASGDHPTPIQIMWLATRSPGGA
jgi:hypothetical protein